MPFHTTIKLNQKQKLYVLSYSPINKNGTLAKKGGFVTCQGFDNVVRDVENISRWLWDNGQAEALQGLAHLSNADNPSEDYYHYYKALSALASDFSLRTGKRCNANLTPQLIGLEGKRVEITFDSGEVARLRVDKSTGWMPIHLDLPCSSEIRGVRLLNQQ